MIPGHLAAGHHGRMDPVPALSYSSGPGRWVLAVTVLGSARRCSRREAWPSWRPRLPRPTGPARSGPGPACLGSPSPPAPCDQTINHNSGHITWIRWQPVTVPAGNPNAPQQARRPACSWIAWVFERNGPGQERACYDHSCSGRHAARRGARPARRPGPERLRGGMKEREQHTPHTRGNDAQGTDQGREDLPGAPQAG